MPRFDFFADFTDGSTSHRTFELPSDDVGAVFVHVADMISAEWPGQPLASTAHPGHGSANNDPVRVYQISDVNGQATRIYRPTPTPETVPSVELSTPALATDPAPEAATTPRVTRKVCQRPDCGMDCQSRYYVHTDAATPTTRRLWCGSCVSRFALTDSTGQRWDRAMCAVHANGDRYSPPDVTRYGLTPCAECTRVGDRECRGVFVDLDGTMSDRCIGCVPASIVILPRDGTDTQRTLRWVRYGHPEMRRVSVDTYGSAVNRWASDDDVGCPGCGAWFTLRTWRVGVAMPIASGLAVGPSSIRVCHACASVPSTAGDVIAGYHHTIDVTPCRVDDTGAVVRQSVDTIDSAATRGDRGFAGRWVPPPPTRFGARPVPPRRAPWLAGVELEIAAINGTPAGVIARQARLSMGELWAESKRDGSVEPDGVEVVSHPATIGAHRATWSKWKAPNGAEANKSCGFHVHINRESLSPGQIDRLCYMLSRRWDAAAWATVFRRQPNTYCKNYTPGSFAARNWRREVEKYRVLNLSPRNTIEFRWPAGTIRGSTILATIEIIHALCLYTAPGAAGGGHRPDVLCWSAFAAWMQTDAFARSETKTARAYLARRGLIAGRKPRPGETVRVDDGTDAGMTDDETAPIDDTAPVGYQRIIADRYPTATT